MAQTTYGGSVASPGAAASAGDSSRSGGQSDVDRLKEKAAQRASQATGEAAEKGDQLKHEAAEAVDLAKEKAIEAACRAKESGRQYADEKKARVADEIGVFSGAIRKAAGKLHEEQHSSIASYVDVAAEQLDQLRDSLDRKDLSQIVDDLQDFTRRRPEVVYGGLFVAGLAAMRFLKASKPSRQRLTTSAQSPRSAYRQSRQPDLPPSTVAAKSQAPGVTRSPQASQS